MASRRSWVVWWAERVAVVGALVLGMSPVARAEVGSLERLASLSAADRERARGLLDEGDEKLGRGDARGALAAYLAADEIVAVPTTGIEVGRAQVALGLWVEARDTWVRVTRYPKQPNEPRPFTEARIEAERLAIHIGARIPTMVVEFERARPDGLVVELDGRELPLELLGVPLRVNPGPHRLRAHAPGHRSEALEITAHEGRRHRVSLELATSVSAPGPVDRPVVARSSRSSVARTAMWAGFATGLTGAAVGTATGIWAFEQTRAASEQCAGTACPVHAADDIEQAKTAGVISTVAFAVSGVGLGVGVWQAVVLATAGSASPRSASSARGAAGRGPRVSVAPDGLGARFLLSGTFP